MADADPPADAVAALRAACLGLPEVVEEEAWVGTRWRVRGRTFAHVLVVDGAWPPAYARAAATDGPATLLMFRAPAEEAAALRAAGPPLFAPVWRADEIGLVLDDGGQGGPRVDWEEVAELVTESYCAVAPRALAALVDRPPPR